MYPKFPSIEAATAPTRNGVIEGLRQQLKQAAFLSQAHTPKRFSPFLPPLPSAMPLVLEFLPILPPAIPLPPKPFQGHDGAVLSLAISVGGDHILSGGADNKLCLWDRNARCLWSAQTAPGASANIAFTPNGKYVISGGKGNQFIIWDRMTGKQRGLEEHKGGVSTSIGISQDQDGKFFLQGTEEGYVYLFNRINGKRIKFKAHTGAVLTVAMSADGQCVFSAGADKKVHILDPITKETQGLFSTLVANSLSSRVSADGRWFLWINGDDTLQLIDFNDTKITYHKLPNSNQVSSIAISPEGEFIYVGYSNGKLDFRCTH